MAGGTLSPSSDVIGDTSGRLFTGVYAGAGGNNAAKEAGWQVAASIGSDTGPLSLRFAMPPAAALPSGTLKLLMRALANASTGAAKVTVQDGVAANGVSPSAVSLTSETQATVTWGASDNDKYKDTKVTLSATPAGNDELLVALTFNATGWTLAAMSTWRFYVIWE
jgi:hypothetical protein